MRVCVLGSGSGGNSTYSGALSGPGKLTKTGAGTLTLAGVGSNLAGKLTITGGTMEVTEDIAFGDLDVNGPKLTQGILWPRRVHVSAHRFHLVLRGPAAQWRRVAQMSATKGRE